MILKQIRGCETALLHQQLRSFSVQIHPEEMKKGKQEEEAEENLWILKKRKTPIQSLTVARCASLVRAQTMTAVRLFPPLRE